MKTDELHFNDLQHKTRTIASTWILAGFGAIAYFIKTSDPVLAYFSSYTMINMICLMVVIGLFILWIIDQLVYQRLLNSNFVAGLFQEFTDNETPPIRVMMVISSGFRGMSRLYNYFYFIPMSAFTLFSTFALLIELFLSPSEPEIMIASSIIGVGLICIYISIWLFVFNNKRDTPFLNLLQAFDDKEFEKISTPEKCYEIVKAWSPKPSTR